MSGMSFAGQYSNPNGTDEDLMQRVQQAFQALKTAGINGVIEIETASRSVRVTVDPTRRDAAREVLKEILPNIPRRLRMRVDAASLRRVTPAMPVLMPNDEIIIGRSSMGAHNEKVVLIEDDSKIARQHLRVRWDGLSKLEVKDIGGQNDARIDTVEIGPEWMELEPGAKVRIGDTTVSFQLGDPVN